MPNTIPYGGNFTSRTVIKNNDARDQNVVNNSKLKKLIKHSRFIIYSFVQNAPSRQGGDEWTCNIAMAEPFLLRAKTPRLRPRNASGVSPRDSEADVFTFWLFASGFWFCAKTLGTLLFSDDIRRLFSREKINDALRGHF